MYLFYLHTDFKKNVKRLLFHINGAIQKRIYVQRGQRLAILTDMHQLYSQDKRSRAL